MKIGIPRESGGSLVAVTPVSVGKLKKLGYDVVVETCAGELAHYPDSAYADAGATVASTAETWGADVVVSVSAPNTAQLEAMTRGSTYLGRLAPARNPELLEAFAERGINAIAMDAVPRISRAQAMDVLSSQANLAGYRAVVEAANAFGRLFTGQVTAAGKVAPAKVYVIGAGVAGLAAIGTANSMGAIVSGTDVRPEVADQVESMGARFVPIPTASVESTDGYARELSTDQAERAHQLYAAESAKSDIVITTANIPGRKAPLLLTAADIAAMKPGSVIVDMAAANGGNTELTVAGETIVTPGGVTIVGHRDLAARLPSQASQLYGQNVVNLLTLMTPSKDGVLTFDFDDDVVRGVTVALVGEISWPPPPIAVSAANGPSIEELREAEERAARERTEAAAAKRREQIVGLAVAALALGALVLATPAAVASHYIVLVLAVILGFHVISAVSPALHTPLMSVTNAISGIVLLGGIGQVGSSNTAISALSFVAIVLATINIFGGFAVTHRMLAMFRK